MVGKMCHMSAFYVSSYVGPTDVWQISGEQHPSTAQPAGHAGSSLDQPLAYTTLIELDKAAGPPPLVR